MAQLQSTPVNPREFRRALGHFATGVTVITTVEEFQLTESELRHMVDFLTRVGQQHEFQLLFDVLGMSVLVPEIIIQWRRRDDYSYSAT